MRISTFLAVLSSITLTEGFSPVSNRMSAPVSTTELSATTTRTQFIQGAAAAAFVSLVSPSTANAGDIVSLPSGTSYEIIKTGTGPKPNLGELAAIRFSAYVKQTGNKIDDIFDTPEPYYTRVGSGGLLKVR